MSACYCDYGDGPSVFQQSQPKARKEHRCDECSGAIFSGEKYERAWGIWEGTSYSFKRCADCSAFFEWVVVHVPCFCDRFGELHLSAIDCLDEYEPECPGIGKEARDRIRAIKSKRRAIVYLT